MYRKTFVEMSDKTSEREITLGNVVSGVSPGEGMNPHFSNSTMQQGVQ
jgi:hypothetical protein